MSDDMHWYDPTIIDQAIALLRTEHARAVAQAGSLLDAARALALAGSIEPVSGDWSNADRFWVRAQHSDQSYQVTTGKQPTCDCPDFARAHTACEHIWAVSIVCLARFRFGSVLALAQEMREYAEDEGIDDDAWDDDVVARAIQEMEEEARHYE